MKRIAMVVVALMMWATSAQAMDSGLGGYIYWSAPDCVNSRPAITSLQLYRLELTPTWTVATSGAMFDCIAYSNSYLQTNASLNNNLEVFDPRDQGGQGNILHTTILPGYPGSSWSQPWQIIKENPTTKVQTNLCDGASAGWNSYLLGKVVVAPANWQGYTTNGLSLAGGPSYFINRIYAMHDANSSGKIDDSASEAANVGSGQPYDQEMGKDGALYFTSDKIYKLSSTGTQTSFFDVTTGGLSGFTDGRGLAVGKGTSDPIVYVNATDASSGKGSIFALRDLNSDGVGDCVTRVWTSGDFGVNLQSNFYSMEDLEYYLNPETGKQFLLFNSYYEAEGLFAIELTDDGLAGVDGKNIATAAQDSHLLPGGYNGGFEIDMNPVAGVPEPATLLLLGTGALGAVGWMRRRRVK